MEAHPLTETTWRRTATAGVLLATAVVHSVLLVHYTHANWTAAIADALVSVGWLGALSYVAWFVAGVVSVSAMQWLTGLAGVVLWLAGSVVTCDFVMRFIEQPTIPFLPTLPFRMIFGLPAWMALLLWYRLLQKDADTLPAADLQSASTLSTSAPQEPVEYIDRITVKDGSRIHIVKTGELLYIQACGDYTTLVTPTGQYVKEQTMKYFETHLPATEFVRIHRSTIVNVGQISRVEQFGKETYQVLLKDGTRLRVSLNGYRLLRQRLGI